MHGLSCLHNIIEKKNKKCYCNFLYFYLAIISFIHKHVINLIYLSVISKYESFKWETLYFDYEDLFLFCSGLMLVMPPFEEEWVYCFANVGLSVDKMVSADYLKYHLSQSLYILHVDWSWLVDDPTDFGVTRSKVKVKGGIRVILHFLFKQCFSHILVDSYLQCLWTSQLKQ